MKTVTMLSSATIHVKLTENRQYEDSQTQTLVNPLIALLKVVICLLNICNMATSIRLVGNICLQHFVRTGNVHHHLVVSTQ